MAPGTPVLAPLRPWSSSDLYPTFTITTTLLTRLMSLPANRLFLEQEQALHV